MKKFTQMCSFSPFFRYLNVGLGRWGRARLRVSSSLLLESGVLHSIYWFLSGLCSSLCSPDYHICSYRKSEGNAGSSLEESELAYGSVII